MDDFPERPPGVLPSGSGFSVAKFLGLTVALAAGAGVGVGGYLYLRDADTPGQGGDETPTPTTATPDVGKADDEPPPAAKKDVPPVRPVDEPPADSGPIRLDVPDPWGVSPSDAPSDGPGPDVETPAWEEQ